MTTERNGPAAATTPVGIITVCVTLVALRRSRVPS